MLMHMNNKKNKLKMNKNDDENVIFLINLKKIIIMKTMLENRHDIKCVFVPDEIFGLFRSQRCSQRGSSLTSS